MSDIRVIRTGLYSKIAYFFIEKALRDEFKRKKSGLFFEQNTYLFPLRLFETTKTKNNQLFTWDYVNKVAGYSIPFISNNFASIDTNGEIILRFIPYAIFNKESSMSLSLQRLAAAIDKTVNDFYYSLLPDYIIEYFNNDILSEAGKDKVVQTVHLISDRLRGMDIEPLREKYSDDLIDEVVGKPFDPFKQAFFQVKMNELRDFYFIHVNNMIKANKGSKEDKFNMISKVAKEKVYAILDMMT